MKEKFFEPMIKTAQIWASMSRARRKKVGAVLSTDDGRILATGYNGTVSGLNNVCEHEEYCLCCEGNGYVDDTECIDDTRIECPVCKGYGSTLNTKEEVLHAEQNIISFCARNGISTNGTILFVTLSPCTTCAKLIAQSGIKEVYFTELYRDSSGVEFLESLDVKITQLKGL